MYRLFPYLLLFAVTMLLQVFLFDNLSISIYLNPLVYVVFLALLPLNMPSIALLGVGLVTGVAMDSVMGVAGLNTIATLLIAFLRPTIAGIVFGRDNAREGGVPAPDRFSKRTFLIYLIVVTLLHHAVFFSLESLSWTHLAALFLRIVASSAVSVFFGWFLVRLFTAKLSVRI